MPKFKKIPLEQAWAGSEPRTSDEERKARAFRASMEARQALKKVDKDIEDLNHASLA